MPSSEDEEASVSEAASESSSEESEVEDDETGADECFTSLDQIEHEGLVFIKRKTWDRHWCTLRRNALRFYAPEESLDEDGEHEGPFYPNNVRNWEDERGKVFTRGIVLDVTDEEGKPSAIILRCDTIEDKQCWEQILTVVLELQKEAQEGEGITAHAADDQPDEESASAALSDHHAHDKDSDDSEDSDAINSDAINSDHDLDLDSDGEDGEVDLALLLQRDTLLKASEIGGPAFAVFQVDASELRRVKGQRIHSGASFNNGDAYVVLYSQDLGNNGLRSAMQRNIYYWIGTRTAPDKASVACIKAVELRRALGGKCVIQREDEGQESPEFLFLFDGELKVLDGGSTGLRVLHRAVHWSELPPLMYLVTSSELTRASILAMSMSSSTAGVIPGGRPASTGHSSDLQRRLGIQRSFGVRRVAFSKAQLRSDRVLVVDDRRKQIYVWRGEATTFRHKQQGMEGATCLKGDDPRGAKVIQLVDQGQEDTEWHELFASRTALGRNDPHSSSMDTHYDCDTPTTLPLSPSPAEDAFDQDDAEEAEDTKPPTGMMLLRVTCTPQEASAAPSLSQSMTSTVSGHTSYGPLSPSSARIGSRKSGMQLSLVCCADVQTACQTINSVLEPEEDDKVPSLSMLTAHPDGAFILDCGTELFVWHGAQANRTVRLGALKVAGQLLRSSDDRPSWADEIVHVREGREPFLFRCKFADWGAVARPQQALVMPQNFYTRVRNIAGGGGEQEALAYSATRIAQFIKDHASREVETPEDKLVRQAGAASDKGEGELLVWRISYQNPKGVAFVEDEYVGNFSSTCSYVLLYGFADEQSGTSTTGTDASDHEGTDLDSDAEESDHQTHSHSRGVSSPGSHSQGSRGRRNSTSIMASIRDSAVRDSALHRHSHGGTLGGTLASSTCLLRLSPNAPDQHRSEPAVDNSTEHANDTIKSYTTARGSVDLLPADGTAQPQAALSPDCHEADNERSDDEDEYESAADEEEEEDDVERLLASRNGDADESFSSDDEGSNGSNTNDESDSQQDLDDGDESQCSSNDNARPHGHRGMGNAKGKYIVYYWQGARARRSDWVHWQMCGSKCLMPQWKRVMGDLTVVRVMQGREPEQLRRLFASGKRSQEQRICVHERQWRRIVDPDWRVSLFKVQTMPHGTVQAFQVPPTMASFSSKNVYVCIRSPRLDSDGVPRSGADDQPSSTASTPHTSLHKETVWYWQGRYSTAMLQEEGSGMMLALLRYHGLSFNVDLTVLDEQQLLDPEADQAGLEDMIEHALGQSMGEQYADYRGVFPPDYDVDEDPFGDLVPRLYVLDTRSGQVAVRALGFVQQQDLSDRPETVAILTAPEAVYVWKGPKADEKHYNVLFQAATNFARGRGEERARDEALAGQEAPVPTPLPGSDPVSGGENTTELHRPASTGCLPTELAQAMLPGDTFTAFLASQPPEVAKTAAAAARRYSVVKAVLGGKEPLEFKAHFQCWDDAPEKAYVDVYEQRLAQRANTNQLGDAQHLRGRVLGDDEAKHYWSAKQSTGATDNDRAGTFLTGRSLPEQPQPTAPLRQTFTTVPTEVQWLRPVIPAKTAAIAADAGRAAIAGNGTAAGGAGRRGSSDDAMGARPPADRIRLDESCSVQQSVPAHLPPAPSHVDQPAVQLAQQQQQQQQQQQSLCRKGSKNLLSRVKKTIRRSFDSVVMLDDSTQDAPPHVQQHVRGTRSECPTHLTAEASVDDHEATVKHTRTRPQAVRAGAKSAGHNKPMSSTITDGLLQEALDAPGVDEKINTRVSLGDSRKRTARNLMGAAVYQEEQKAATLEIDTEGGTVKRRQTTHKRRKTTAARNRSSVPSPAQRDKRPSFKAAVAMIRDVWQRNTGEPATPVHKRGISGPAFHFGKKDADQETSGVVGDLMVRLEQHRRIKSLAAPHRRTQTLVSSDETGPLATWSVGADVAGG